MSSEPLFMNVVNGLAEMSPVAKVLGWKFLKYNSEEKEVHVEFDASNSLVNPMGCIQVTLTQNPVPFRNRIPA